MDMMTMNLTDFEEMQKTVNTVLLPIGMIEAHGGKILLRSQKGVG